MSKESKSVPGRDWSWRSRALRGLLYQAIAIALLVALIWYLASNTLTNMRVRGIQSGFDFLNSPAGFQIGESLFDFDSNQTYGIAFLVGLTNTLRVALVGIFFTTLLGILLGVGQLSRNFLVRALCRVYVEVFRNIPLLLQLFIWYIIFTQFLPANSEPLHPVPWVFLSQNGLQYPIPSWEFGHLLSFLGLIAGVIAAWMYKRAAIRHLELTGRIRPLLWPALALIIGGAVLGWLLGGAPNEVWVPEPGEFTIAGGGAITPEYMTLLLGLTLYTASFVAEIVRGGIQSVSVGQTEASSALGLSRTQSLRLVLLPQALRVIIPPMTSQYLNLTKNSSLAVVIGYPDLVSISNTSLNQTGRAVECIAVIMAVYLAISLATAGLMNLYNRKVAIKER